MTLEGFLRAFTRGKLRSKPHGGLQETAGLQVPAGFKVEPCNDKAMWSRVERGAEFDETSIELFLWRAICSWVDCAEEDMVIHPRTGQSIARGCELREDALSLRLSRAGLADEQARRAIGTAKAATV